jgi:DNA-directed RNA polymerase subunit RPC12/RpoP
MPQGASVPVVNERFLAERLERLAAAITGDGDLLDVLDVFARPASDDALVRINPVRFGQRCGFSTAAVVELFLHARKLGLLTMEWQYVCPGCGEIVERLTSLTSATAHYFCQVCSADRDADLSDFIEVTFSLSPEIRRSRYHDPGRSNPRSTSSTTASRRAAWWTMDPRYATTYAAAPSCAPTWSRARRRRSR